MGKETAEILSFGVQGDRGSELRTCLGGLALCNCEKAEARTAQVRCRMCRWHVANHVAAKGEEGDVAGVAVGEDWGNLGMVDEEMRWFGISQTMRTKGGFWGEENKSTKHACVWVCRLACCHFRGLTICFAAGRR